MDSVAEQLAHFFEQRVPPTSAACPIPLNIDPSGAPMLLTQLLDERRVIALTGSEENALVDASAQSSLAELAQNAQRTHTETGVHALRLCLGELRPPQDPDAAPQAGAPFLKIPIYLSRTPTGDWEIHTSLHSIEVHPALRGPLLELQGAEQSGQGKKNNSPFPGSVQGPKFKDWWSLVLSKLAQLEAKLVDFSFALYPLTLACHSDVHATIREDLNPQDWGGNEVLASHPILSGLLGPGFLPEERQKVFTTPYLEGQENASDYPWIQDADQFQAQAILAAVSGEPLVIQGPCGSGKTQTITNIVAALVDRGKRVLVVSGDCLDLQNLERRIAQAQLSPACLSLYDEQRAPEAMALDLVQALRWKAPNIPDRSEFVGRYQELHETLNGYTQAMRESLGQSGWSYQEVVGRLIAAKREAQGLPKLAFDPIAHWTQEDYEHALELVTKLQGHMQTHGSMAASPFGSLDLSEVTVENTDEWCEQIAKALATLQAFLQNCDEVFSELALPPPVDVESLGQWVRGFAYLNEIPDLSGIELEYEAWSAKAQSAVELLTCGTLCTSIRQAHESTLLEPAWEADLMQLRGSFREKSAKWWRKASKEWRDTQTSLKGLVQGELPQDPQDVLTLIDAVIHYQSERRTLERLSPVGEALFGAHWCGIDSNWDKLQGCTDWVVGLLDKIESQEVPADFWHALTLSTQTLHTVGEFCQQYENLKEQLQDLEGTLKTSLLNQSLDGLEQALSTWSEQKQALVAALEHRSLELNLRGVGLGQLVTLAQSWEHPLEAMGQSVTLSYLRGLESSAFAERSELREATRDKLEALRREFVTLDRQLPVIAQERLGLALHQRLPELNEAARLELLADLQDPGRRGNPEALLRDHSETILAVKPIVLTTPSRLARVFAQTPGLFDTVLIESAGALPLAHAMGGMLRAKQVIAIGDSRQSPRSLSDYEQPSKGKPTSINPYQSVLYRCRQQGAKEYLLSLHYRSAHDSLIHYVNHAFYEGKLKVASSPASANQERGLIWQESGDHPCEDHATGKNPGQARAVAIAAAKHLLHNPDQSLGILTLSESQRECIAKELQSLAEQKPELHALLDSQRPEPFFLHSIDAVPRDDRNTIFLSFGFGLGQAGEVSTHWGVLGGPDGHRNLAKALSRARQRMHVFSNIDAQSFCIDEHTPTALSTFVGFLEQARGSSLRICENATRSTNRFTQLLRAEIEDLGFAVRSPATEHELDADLYVYDPERPDSALVGILCDSVRYHEQKVARDRERIGPSLLGSMGWALHRIWCRDWLADPDKARQHLLETLKHLQSHLQTGLQDTRFPGQRADEAANQGQAAPLGSAVALRCELNRNQDESLAPLPFSLYPSESVSSALPPGQEVQNLTPVELVPAIVAVLQAEHCIHVDFLALRLAQSLGLSGLSLGLRERIGLALDKGVRNNEIQRHGSFVSLEDSPKLSVRNRCALPRAQRRLDWVPPQELDEALRSAVEPKPLKTGSSSTLPSNESILTEALERLGLADQDSTQRKTLEKRLAELDSAGQLRPEAPRELIDEQAA